MRICSVEGCAEKHQAKGFCKKHYMCWWKRGDPARIGSERRPRAPCSIDGCELPHSSRGYCQKHYQQWRRRGDPLAVLPHGGGPVSVSPITRLLDNIDIQQLGPLDPCWVWVGYTDKAGYGRIGRVRGKPGSVLAHRFSYQELVGPISKGLDLDHVYVNGCRSRACCNPDHLEPVTRAENLRRRDEARRQA